MAEDKASRDVVVIERTFDAPTDVMWEMWTQPEPFKARYGPNESTVPVARMDVRVGGSRLVCMEMKTPAGPMTMWFTCNYREIVKSKRLVYTESMSDENGNVLSPSDLGMPEGHPTTTGRLENCTCSRGADCQHVSTFRRSKESIDTCEDDYLFVTSP